MKLNFDETEKYLKSRTTWEWEYQRPKTAAWEYLVIDPVTGRKTPCLIPYNPSEQQISSAIKLLYRYFDFFKTFGDKIAEAQELR